MRDKNSTRSSLRDELVAGTALPPVGSIPTSPTALDLSAHDDLVITPGPTFWQLVVDLVQASEEDTSDALSRSPRAVP